MVKCDFCGKEDVSPFQRPFCEEYFCIERPLSENHTRLRAPARTSFRHQQAQKLTELTIFSFSPRKSEREKTEEVVKVEWKRRPKLKIRLLGLIAGVLALISLILPWWYFQISATLLEMSVSTTITVDLYKAMFSTTITGEVGQIPYVAEFPMDMWFGRLAFNLILVAGIITISGGLVSGRIGKTILVFSGILLLSSIIVYTYGLQNELSMLTDELRSYPYSFEDFPEIQLFSSGTFSLPERPVPAWKYSSYLYFGFWVNLIASILAFVSTIRH